MREPLLASQRFASQNVLPNRLNPSLSGNRDLWSHQ